MPRDMFGHVTRPSVSIGNRKWYTVPLSLLSHSIVVAVVVVVPLMATDVLPSPFQPMVVDYVPVAPVPAPPPPPRFADRQPRVERAIPVDAPDGFAPERPRPPASVEDTAAAGPNIIDGEIDRNVVLAPPPETPKPVEPVRIGGQVRAPQKVRDVRPVYSQFALAARVQGIVIIEATIGVDGRVVNARVLRSVPLLDQAALDAVRQWEYVPTTLNGVAVPVVMTVTVSFVLGG